MSQPAAIRTVEILNPFRLPGSWFTGGLHLHTTASDGTLTPEQTLTLARDSDYDFLAITDHECVTLPDAVPPGMVHVPGVEYATYAPRPDRYWHVIALGTQKCLAMPGYPVNAILKLVAEVAPFYYVAHPYWSNLGGDDLLRLPPFHALEIYNHFAELWLQRGHAEYHWDYLLSAGRRVWGVAADDAHRPEHFGVARVVVRAHDCTLPSILAALSRGAFYSTTGPRFLHVEVTQTGVHVRTTPVRQISFVANTANGKVVEAASGGEVEEASYEFRGKEIYMRVQCTDRQGMSAWTNPVIFWTASTTPEGAKST